VSDLGRSDVKWLTGHVRERMQAIATAKLNGEEAAVPVEFGEDSLRRLRNADDQRREQLRAVLLEPDEAVLALYLAELSARSQELEGAS
jgi:hypothetical protein